MTLVVNDTQHNNNTIMLIFVAPFNNNMRCSIWWFPVSGCLPDVREDIGASQRRAEGFKGQAGGLLPGLNVITCGLDH
jgi:hypothetical protein